MSLDLGNPQDFGKATQGAVGATAGLLQLFSGGIENWDIEEAAYVSNSSKEKGKPAVIFHVFESKQEYAAGLSEIQDSGGRRKVSYLFPYKDGQTTDDLGRQPEDFSLSVIIHGPRYLKAYKDLFKELNKPEPGTLFHPIRGPLECVLDDFTITHKSDARQAMTLSLKFMEHNFTVGDLGLLTDDLSIKSALSRALQIFEDINAAIAAVQGAIAFVQSVRSAIENLLEKYSAAYAEILNVMNKLFNSNRGGTVNDIPGLVPLNEGGLLDEDGNRADETFTVVQSPNDPFINVPVESLNPEIAIAATVLQVEKQVNVLRDDVNEILSLYESLPDGELEFFEDIKNLKASAIALQEVLEAGKASSRTTIINYVVPSVMSLREAIYRNGVSLDRLIEIEALNPDLKSVNFLEKGLTLRIPK